MPAFSSVFAIFLKIMPAKSAHPYSNSEHKWEILEETSEKSINSWKQVRSEKQVNEK